LFVGTSIIAKGIAPDVIWHETGLSSYNRSTSRLSPQLNYLYLQDSFKTQTPKLVVMYTPYLGRQEKKSSFIDHRNMDSLKLSTEKVAMAFALQNTSESAIDYIAPILFNHSRWNKKISRGITDNYTRGQAPNWKIRNPEDPNISLRGTIDADSEVDYPMDETALAYYSKAIEFCKSKGSDVLLISLPTINWSNETHTATADLAAKFEIPFLELASDSYLEKLQINEKTDYYDHKHPEHLNGFGAEKVSRYIGNYIKENYDLPDKRDKDSAEAKQWKKDVVKYYKNYDKISAKIEGQKAKEA
jgi:hypothetical protein